MVRPLNRKKSTILESIGSGLVIIGDTVIIIIVKIMLKLFLGFFLPMLFIHKMELQGELDYVNFCVGILVIILSFIIGFYLLSRNKRYTLELIDIISTIFLILVIFSAIYIYTQLFLVINPSTIIFKFGDIQIVRIWEELELEKIALTIAKELKLEISEYEVLLHCQNCKTVEELRIILQNVKKSIDNNETSYLSGSMIKFLMIAIPVVSLVFLGKFVWDAYFIQSAVGSLTENVDVLDSNTTAVNVLTNLHGETETIVTKVNKNFNILNLNVQCNSIEIKLLATIVKTLWENSEIVDASPKSQITKHLETILEGGLVKEVVKETPKFPGRGFSLKD